MFTNQQLQDAFINSYTATKTNLVLGNADVNAVAFVDMMKQEFVATANGDTGAFNIRMDQNVRAAARRVNPQLAGATLVKALNEISTTIYALVASIAQAEAKAEAAKSAKGAVAPTKSLMAEIAAKAQAFKANRVDAVTEAVAPAAGAVVAAAPAVVFSAPRGLANEFHAAFAARQARLAAPAVVAQAPVLALEDADRANDHRLARAAARNVARMR